VFERRDGHGTLSYTDDDAVSLTAVPVYLLMSSEICGYANLD
jgi:hypothetical protein